PIHIVTLSLHDALPIFVAMNIPALDKYVEILCNDKSKWKNLVARHKKLMNGLCNMNREDGFLQGGRGKKRKYVLGNVLLEVLVQDQKSTRLNSSHVKTS